MFDFDDVIQETYATIKVVNISENEDNELKKALANECEYIEFITMNSDLSKNRKEFEDTLHGSDLTFIIVEDDNKSIQLGTKVADYVSGVGSLTVGVVKRFADFELDDWESCNDENIKQFQEKLDTILAISKVHLLPIIKSMYNLIAIRGLINLDFADLKYVLQDSDYALIGNGRASGENASVDAVKMALDTSSLKTTIKNAARILLKFTGAGDFMSMMEVNEGVVALQEIANPDANIIFGASLDNTMGENISVNIIATGFVNPDDMIDDDAKVKPMLDIPLGWVRGEVGAEVNKNKSTQTVGDYLDSLSKKSESNDDLAPHANGKKVCETLRNMRKELAKTNNIPFESKDCDFNGLCAGTCEKCDEEAAYLRQKLLEISPEGIKYPHFDKN